MLDSSFSGVSSTQKVSYSKEEIEDRKEQIEAENQSQNLNLSYHSYNSIELQKKLQVDNNLKRDKCAIVAFFTFLGVAAYNAPQFLQTANNLEESSMSDLTDSINKFKDLVNDLDKRKPLLESLLKTTSFTEISKSNALEELQEIFTTIFKFKNEFDELGSKVENLENQLQFHKNYLEKGKINNINRADRFAWDIRETIWNIENEYLRERGKNIPLSTLAEILNERKVETPTGNGTWYATTVKLMKERIKKIQHSKLVNLLE